MKKLISALLALILILSITACGTPNDPASKDSGNNTNTQKPPVSNAVLPDFQKTATISETVLYDENDIRITANELIYTSYYAVLNLTIENNSNKDLTFHSNTMSYSCNSVNGYMITDGYMNCDVPAGKKAVERMSFRFNILMQYGIFEIADIEVGIHITDDDYNNIYIEPKQLKTTAAEGYDYQSQSYQKTIVSDAAQNTYHYTLQYFTDEILYNKNGISVVSGCISVNDKGDAALLLEIQNTSQMMVIVSANDIYLNGICINCSTYSTERINPGKISIVELELSSILDSDFWDMYGIKNIGSVSLSMDIKNSDGDELCDPAVINVTNTNTTPTLSKDGQDVYNANGIRIAMKGIVQDDSEYSNDIYVMMLIENNSSKEILVQDVYDSFSMNGFMMDGLIYDVKIRSGACGVLKIKIRESDLQKNAISTPDDIKEVEFTAKITDNDRNAIDTALISISVQ